MTRARKLKVSLLAAGGAAVLAACSVHPGAAAVVGGQRISVDRVDAVAQALCSANSGGGQPLASRGARQGALSVLLESTLSHEFGQAKGYTADRSMVSKAVENQRSNINTLPQDERPAFEQALRDYAEGQLILLDAGRRYLASHGQTAAGDQQALAIGQKLRERYVQRNDVNVAVDPRFGSFNDKTGTLNAGSGSLSVAVSSRAADGQSPDPSAGWVASLPASQQCG